MIPAGGGAMKRRDVLKAGAGLVSLAAGGGAGGGTERDYGVVRTEGSPHAALRGLDLASVRWTEGFWAERHRQTRQVTLRRLWELLADPAAGHVLENFRAAAGRSKGGFAGAHWQDAWLYKWIEAAACLYRVSGEGWIDERMDEGIELIAAAQQPDGYIATQITARGRKRWQDPRAHEAYVMGHLLTAACVHRRMTGKRTLFDVALRTADYLAATLGVTVDSGFAHNPTAVMGLAELYRETGRRRYLEAARRIVEDRGHRPKRGGLFDREPGLLGTDQIQDRVPVRRSREVVGHNVFFTYLYAGAADVCLETGDTELKAALERLWEDLAQRKISINGGVSPMGKGISIHNDPVAEAVGKAYFLPCADAYNETCGQIGHLMWSYRMLLLSPRARYADAMELQMFNGFLGGIGLDAASWFYRNPLRRYEKDHVPQGLNDLRAREQPGRRRICCPTNLLRALAQLQNYVCSVSGDGLWVHHYGGCTIDADLPGGGRIRLAQRTDYPWDGEIALAVEAVEGDAAFAIHLRIPGWAEGAAVALNGKKLEEPEAGRYFRIHRRWKAGDRVELSLPMTPRLMEAHPKAEALRNQVAVMRGPLLYCLESPDLPEGVRLEDVYVPGDIALEPRRARDLPFGIVALEGEALHAPGASWSGELYRRLQKAAPRRIRVRLIPYFAWSNRGPSAMSVWLPLAVGS